MKKKSKEVLEKKNVNITLQLLPRNYSALEEGNKNVIEKYKKL